MSALDRYDALGALGVAFLAVGLWMVYPAASLIAVGLVLIVLAARGK